jgi:hypothetical protein
MPRLIFLLLILVVPASAFAATTPASFSAGRTVLSASTSPGNAYAIGISVVVTAPSLGDVTLAGGSLLSAAPIQGDALFIGGSINSRASVEGDVRAIGGNIILERPIAGDLVAFGFSVSDMSRPKGSVFIGGANVTLVAGAGGPVTIYGNNIFLDGEFSSDVRIFSSGRVRLAPTAVIRGSLSYEAPEPAVIPASVVIEKGITYTNATYLPDAGTSRLLAYVSIGFFLFVRILGALILAGLLAGLFPRLAESVVQHLYTRDIRSILLTMLLGFGILVATPVLLTLLLLTFVGMGLALLLLILYVLLLLLAVMYSGILIGSIFARRFARRETVLWRDGVLGMLVFSLIALLPIIGLPLLSVLMLFTAGTLLQLFFNFVFPRNTSE